MKERVIIPLLFILFAPGLLQARKTLLVSTCMSLRLPLARVTSLYQRTTGIEVNINAASSGKLALQIERGAPVDLFVSASAFWMDRLEKEGLIDPTTRVLLLSNSLVLAAPKDSPLSSLKDITKASRIAMGDYHFSPLGRYARETLEVLGLWSRLQDRLVLADNASQAITWLITGNVDAGLVYYSDYLAFRDRLKLVARIPPHLHSPIGYWVATVKGSRHKKEALNLERFLCSPQASAVFTGYGFSVVPHGGCP